MYEYYQPNEKHKKACDCVVRALTKTCNMTWEQVYRRLCEIGLAQYDMPNSPEVYRIMLLEQGFKMNTIKATKGSKRPTVESFAKKHKNGVCVLEVANHIVAVVNGCYFDTWDCGNKCLYRYHEKAI